MDMCEFLGQFEFIKSEYDDGSGFWDTYEGEILWLYDSAQISIAARSVSRELILLYQKIMAEQEKYDVLWKNYVVNALYDEMRKESDNNSITVEQIIDEIEVETIVFESKEDGSISINVWFNPPESFREHTALLYCDKNGNPSVAVMEG